MPSLCIIKGHKPLISETFIDSHAERLTGDKVVLYNWYPEYTYEGRSLRNWHSSRSRRQKVKRLLPAFLFDRWVTPHESSKQRVCAFIDAFFYEHQIDVILAEYGFNGADITPHAKELGIPLIVHFHGHDAHRETDLEPYAERYRAMFDYASHLLSVSHHMTEKLVAMGADPEKIIYNPYGPREYFFEIQPGYQKRFIALGRFADIKAPYLTLMAFKEAAKGHHDARLVMIGDGPLREACLSLVKTWGMESQVDFPGALNHEEALPWFSDACGFVQHSVTTSYGDAEGMPNSILEAQAAALPVVATRHAGIVDAVIEGTTGFLVEERDVEGMAERMTQLLDDPSLCRQMGEEAREHVRLHYPIDRHIRTIQKLVDQARTQPSARV